MQPGEGGVWGRLLARATAPVLLLHLRGDLVCHGIGLGERRLRGFSSYSCADVELLLHVKEGAADIHPCI